MERLREYLNSLSTAEQQSYARRCGTTRAYLRKILYTRPKVDGALCRRLDEESGGAVPRASLRPDIWPELADIWPKPEGQQDDAGPVGRPAPQSFYQTPQTFFQKV